MNRFDRSEYLFSYIYTVKVENSTKNHTERQIKSHSEVATPLSSLDTFFFHVPIKQQYRVSEGLPLPFYCTYLPSTQRPHTGVPLLLFHVATHDRARETRSTSRHNYMAQKATAKSRRTPVFCSSVLLAKRKGLQRSRQRPLTTMEPSLKTKDFWEETLDYI